jgi:type II secretory pathway pseudopilin PulG
MTAARARGFTLVEALTVTSVIGVVIAIIVPTVSTLRGSARSARCQSNLRQLGVAASAYAMQNRDRYPAAILYELTAAGLVTKAWDFEQGPGGTVRPGAIASFLSNPTEVQQCPDFHGPSTFGADPYTGYNYNTSYIGAEGRFPELDANGRWRDGWDVARQGLPTARHRRTTTTAERGAGAAARTSSCARHRTRSRTTSTRSTRARRRSGTRAARTCATSTAT